MFSNILIAYDDSTEARKALATGIQLASELHSKVYLATVQEPDPGYYAFAAYVEPNLPATIHSEKAAVLRDLQNAAKKKAAESGVDLETILIDGKEVDGILQALKSTHSDLLVLGLHRHNNGLEWAGTARKLANQCNCSVLAAQ